MGITGEAGAALYGWIALDLELVRALVRLFKWKMRSSLTAFLGTLLFMMVVLGIGYIPIAGPVALIIGAVVGLGGVLVACMGTRTYAPRKVSAAVVGDEQRLVSATDPVTR